MQNLYKMKEGHIKQELDMEAKKGERIKKIQETMEKLGEAFKDLNTKWCVDSQL